MGLDAIGTRHFEIFLTMAVSRTLAEAADTLGLTVAAISKSLKVLERESGLSLFVHEGGRLAATDAARQLLPFAQSAVDHLARARRAAAHLRDGDTGTLILGVAGPALAAIAPRAIARFRQDWPQVRIDLKIDRTAGLIEKLVSGAVDIGVGTPPVRDINAREVALCQVSDLCTTQLCAVLPAGHPLGARPVLRPADLARTPLIALPETSATTRLVAAQFQQAHVDPQTAVVVENALGALALVRGGVGIALVNPLSLAEGAGSGLEIRLFRPRVVLRTCLYLPAGRPLTPAITAFADCLRDAADAETRRHQPG